MGDPRILQETALRYLLAVVAAGSVNKAAAQMNVAPSAISRQIGRLEEDLGTHLFERRSWGMIPSASGELLAAHARRMQLDADRVVEEIMAIEALERGVVRLSSVEGLATAFLPHVILEFRNRYNGINVELHVTSAQDVSRRIREGDSDIGLTFGPTSHKEIEVKRRLPAPIHAVVAAHHPLAGARSLRLAQLEPYPIALPSAETTIRQLLDQSCSRQGLVMRPVFTTNYANALITFAVNGGGIALFGELAMRYRRDSEQFVTIPLEDLEFNTRQLEVHTLAGRILPKSAEAFIEIFLHQFPSGAGTTGTGP
ncbi:LysR family transcriptional regulator [Halodurantibacterium flavum]|uniref:LysR family transcriptional regulator n=1 Tax=Halodurantibacterium flavum TaxID=1382802 RepID=A0ABW4S113_9RHOB